MSKLTGMENIETIFVEGTHEVSAYFVTKGKDVYIIVSDDDNKMLRDLIKEAEKDPSEVIDIIQYLDKALFFKKLEDRSKSKVDN